MCQLLLLDKKPLESLITFYPVCKWSLDTGTSGGTMDKNAHT